MTDPNPSLHRAPFMRRGSAFAALALAGLVVLIFLYVSKVPSGKDTPVDPACLETAQTARRLGPLVHGEIAALTLASHPKPLPEVRFAAPDGTITSLADFKGHTVLFNLWATWCIPCRLEMPALDRLQEKFGGKDFMVVAVNVDTARLDRPKAFLEEVGANNLTLYSDAKAEAVQSLKQAGKLLGLPTTILVGKDGCQLGTLAGPAQWDSQDALAFIDAIHG
jgi:thiol-disulfide isomerase/thioredoxin